MSCKMSLEEICSMVESSVFDRKSAKIDAKSLAVHLIAFANADGGTLAKIGRASCRERVYVLV